VANAMVALANLTLGSSQATVTFSSIPTAGYRDLQLVVSGSTTLSSTIDALNLQYNGDTGGNYYHVYMTGDGSSATSGSGNQANASVGIVSSLAVSTTVVDIMDYSATDKHKSAVSRGNASNWGVRANATRWASTAAITQVLVKTEANLIFAAGTTFALYGVVG
jgi:hypothetical protein